MLYPTGSCVYMDVLALLNCDVDGFAVLYVTYYFRYSLGFLSVFYVLGQDYDYVGYSVFFGSLRYAFSYYYVLYSIGYCKFSLLCVEDCVVYYVSFYHCGYYAFAVGCGQCDFYYWFGVYLGVYVFSEFVECFRDVFSCLDTLYLVNGCSFFCLGVLGAFGYVFYLVVAEGTFCDCVCFSAFGVYVLYYSDSVRFG